MPGTPSSQAIRYFPILASLSLGDINSQNNLNRKEFVLLRVELTFNFFVLNTPFFKEVFKVASLQCGPTISV